MLNSIIPRNFITLCLLSCLPLAAEPMGAGVSSGAADLLAYVLPGVVFLLSLYPHIFLYRSLKRGVEAPAHTMALLFAIVICIVFSVLTAGAVALTIDLATPKEIYLGDGFMKTDVSWQGVISAALSGLIAFLPVLQSVRLLRVLSRKT